MISKYGSKHLFMLDKITSTGYATTYSLHFCLMILMSRLMENSVDVKCFNVEMLRISFISWLNSNIFLIFDLFSEEDICAYE